MPEIFVAESIPFKPDAGNAVVGKSEIILCPSSKKGLLNQQLCKYHHMEVFINKQSFIVAESSNVLQAVNAFGVRELSGLAIAVNMRIIPRAQWETTTLQREDSIVLIRPAQGG